MDITKLNGIMQATDTTVEEKIEASLTLQLYMEYLLNKKAEGLTVNDQEISWGLNDTLDTEKNLLNAALKASDVDNITKLKANHILKLRLANLVKATEYNLINNPSDMEVITQSQLTHNDDVKSINY